jgi:hypothetical protein
MSGKHKQEQLIRGKKKKKVICVVVLRMRNWFVILHVDGFGRILQTDTASVLMEAIGYIKFLQNQVEVFSSTYPTFFSDFVMF